MILMFIGIGIGSVSADMKKILQAINRIDRFEKWYLSVLIGIGRYEKKLIGCTLYPPPTAFRPQRHSAPTASRSQRHLTPTAFCPQRHEKILLVIYRIGRFEKWYLSVSAHMKKSLSVVPCFTKTARFHSLPCFSIYLLSTWQYAKRNNQSLKEFCFY